MTYQNGNTPWNKGKRGVQFSWNKGKKGLQVAWNKGKTGYKLKPHSEESKRKASESLKGRRTREMGYRHSEETKHKISEGNKRKHNHTTKWKGGKHSEETKCKIAEKAKGRKPSLETRKKMSESRSGSKNWLWGKHLSEDTKHKLSESHKGKMVGDNNPSKRPDVRFKISLNRRGIKHTEATKKRISDARKGRFCGKDHPRYGKKTPEEQIKKRSETVKRNGSLKLEKNPNWKGGISYEPYCTKFNERLKERIRERDNRTCQLCNEKEDGHKLDVHHINHDRENCEPQLISLCRKCHGKANRNRDHYEELFMNKLIERGLATRTPVPTQEEK